jgi:hypothetical protein
MGRADHQVKVRGFRIELGEVEATLLRHPSVEACVTVARGTATATRRLVAYVVPARGTQIEAGELRAFVAVSLPEYMVPAHVVVVEALPLTANGKVDRAALLEPTDGAAKPAALVDPRTPLEARLVEIWQDVLSQRPVGIDMNFFDLGGTSLDVRAVQRCVEGLVGRALPIVAFFEHPTIEGMARYLASADDDGQILRARLRRRAQARARRLVGR